MAATLPETTESDEQLAAAIARQGGFAPARDAFERLYRRHAPLLLAFLAARVRAGEQEDLHHEVWERVLRHLPDQFRGGNFRAWLYQIARNAIYDHGRKRRPEPLSNPEVVSDGRTRPADHGLIEDEEKAALARCLERLNPEEAALVRARLTGEDYKEICQRLKLTPERAHRLFHSAKNQLKDCVERALQ